MSISPALMIQQVASTENPGLPGRSASASNPAAVSAAKSSSDSAPPPAASSASQFSTDLRVDSQHQVYYEFVDQSTGDVLFEIPPEALRAIGESLNVPLVGDAGAHGMDVES
jgi:hypothetical protein